ncbi:MAG: M20/M25/M40 family metallo-hydrolase [Anaerolineae bacterium]
MAKEVYSEVFGKPCRFVLAGGSVPVASELSKVSAAEIALIGVGLGSDNIHAPDEHFDEERFKIGFLTIAAFLKRIADGDYGRSARKT